MEVVYCNIPGTSSSFLFSYLLLLNLFQTGSGSYPSERTPAERKVMVQLINCNYAVNVQHHGKAFFVASVVYYFFSAEVDGTKSEVLYGGCLCKSGFLQTVEE